MTTMMWIIRLNQRDPTLVRTATFSNLIGPFKGFAYSRLKTSGFIFGPRLHKTGLTGVFPGPVQALYNRNT
jgi:hypothetical protein